MFFFFSLSIYPPLYTLYTSIYIFVSYSEVEKNKFYKDKKKNGSIFP